MGEKKIPFVGGGIFPVVGVSITQVLSLDLYSLHTLMVKVVHENKRFLLFEHRRMCPVVGNLTFEKNGRIEILKVKEILPSELRNVDFAVAWMVFLARN